MDEDKVLLRIIKLEEDVADIKAHIRDHILTKNEYLEGQDRIVSMLQNIHTEMAATNHALLRHKDRIEKLKKDVKEIQSHFA